MENSELNELTILVDDINRPVEDDEHDHFDSHPLQINHSNSKDQERSVYPTMASESKERVSKLQVIDTLKLNLADSTSDIPAYFGFLKFVYANDADKNDRLSSFIHLATESRPWMVANLIEAYHLPTPDFILSIQTGSIQQYGPYKDRSGIQIETEHAIQHPWVTTSCNKQDVIKLVGNALHRDMCGADVPCISFCNWKSVADHSQLEKGKTLISHLFDTRFVMNDRSSGPRFIHEYQLTKNNDNETSISGWHLDPNHTHFLLFDDGSNDVKNMLLKRQEIEHEFSISKALKSPVNVFDNDIPIVMLLLGGNFTTLIAICQGLENGTPVVVVRDTGGLADIIAQLCRKLSPMDELAEFRKITYIEECKIELKRLCDEEGILSERDDEIKINDQISEIEKYVDVLKEMEELIVIFDAIERKNNLENAVADAMLNGIKYRVENYEQFFSSETRAAELEWCLIWNKIDHALQLLIDRNDKTIVSMNDMNLNKDQKITLTQQLLYEALYRNNVLFVNLLVECGASIEELTEEQLINDGALPLEHVSNKYYPYTHDITINQLKKYVEQIYNSYLREYLGHYISQDISRKRIQARNERFSGFNIGKIMSSNTNRISKIFEGRKIEALYLWFVFMNLPDMAKYLCSRCRNQTVGTLLASDIYFAATRRNTQNKRNLQMMAQEFDRHSRGIIDKCYAKDDDFALKLLKSKATMFYTCFPLHIARRADCRAFLASNTVQKHLHNKWFHNFDYQRRLMKLPMGIWICLSSLLLPMLPIASIVLPSLYKKTSIKENSSSERNLLNRYRPTITYQSILEKTDHRSSKAPNMRERIKWFYEAPVVHFYYYFIFFVSFLGLFSYVLLFDYFPLNIYGEKRSGIQNLPIPITEILLHICIASLIIDEIYQVSLFSQISLQYKSMELDGSNWNSFLYNCIHSSLVCQRISFHLIFMSIDLIIWYIRILYLFAAYEILGPKLTMIYEMVSLFYLTNNIDSNKYMFIWTNVTNSTSTNKFTIVEGNGESSSWQLLRDVLNWGIWKVFGQVAEPYNGAVSENDAYGTFVFIFAVGFTVISNVLLLNVLIAMFNEKILRVQEKSNELWRYQRFWLINEYKDKTVLPPPLNILCYLIQFLNYVICCKCRSRSSALLDPDSGIIILYIRYF
uniref:Transient receptor potential cation channel protein-like protein n=1 Tax=Adineta vaga TaxID=104782 RepID=B3G461_ADIVA|nr:transient receptor potential cation channel protein-like protein [Adineta vaga]